MPLIEILPSDLVGLPWRWIGPAQESDNDGNLWWQLTIADLPDFLVAAETRQAVLADAAEALERFLESFVGTAEWPPLPGGVILNGADPVKAAVRAAEAAGALAQPTAALEFAA